MTMTSSGGDRSRCETPSSYDCVIHHHSLPHAYSSAISLFPQLAWIGHTHTHTHTHRFAELTRGSDVVREAAAADLDSGFGC